MRFPRRALGAGEGCAEGRRLGEAGIAAAKSATSPMENRGACVPSGTPGDIRLLNERSASCCSSWVWRSIKRGRRKQSIRINPYFHRRREFLARTQGQQGRGGGSREGAPAG